MEMEHNNYNEKVQVSYQKIKKTFLELPAVWA